MRTTALVRLKLVTFLGKYSPRVLQETPLATFAKANALQLMGETLVVSIQWCQSESVVIASDSALNNSRRRSDHPTRREFIPSRRFTALSGRRASSRDTTS